MSMIMTMNKKIILGIMVLILTVIASYTIEITYKDSGVKSGNIMEIANNNQPAAYMGSDVLKQLPGGQKDKSEEGPTLTTVLVAAGINNYAKIEILGVKNSSSFNAPKADINDNVVFYYTNHNTLNLVNKNNQHVLVEDVKEVNAQS